MKLVITLNQNGLQKNAMNINNTSYTLTAMYSELSDIMRDAVSYYPDIVANTYFENYEDIDEDSYENDDDLEIRFIEMPYISGAVEGILDDLVLFKKIFEKMNKNLIEEDSYKFDPMIFVVIEGSIKDIIIKKMNIFFKSNNMDLEAIDYLKYCGFDTMKQLGNTIKMNYNSSMFYEDDSLLSAYSITKSLTVTNGVYDMGY